MKEILAVKIHYEQDVVFCRQRARQIARILGFETQDQTRIATAVSEIARNAYKYARDGKVEFGLETEKEPCLQICISDRGPGIKNLDTILSGHYRSETGMGKGFLGARKLMDEFDVHTGPASGTSIKLGKYLPATTRIDKTTIATLVELIAQERPESPLEEIRQQNQELLQALELVQKQKKDLQKKKEELSDLNRELEETNRGVVALYAELDEKASSLQRANDLKTRFISNMSHEVRTPLNSVLSLSQMLLDKMDGDLNEEQTKQVAYIKRSTEELYELVNDLLDIAKIDAGKTLVRVEDFHLQEIFSAIRGMFRPFANDRVALHIDDSPSIEFHSDRGKIAQILRNLVSNALKFTPAGEVRLWASAREDGTVVLCVKDTGIGIRPEDQGRIFEEFSQIESPLQKEIKGTGLGLPLSRKLARLLGGELLVDSAPNQGSTFSVILPRQYTKPRLSAEDGVDKHKLGFFATQSLTDTLNEIKRPGTAPFARKMDEIQKRANAEKLLVIDDNEIARYILSDILMDEGYLTIEAERGEEGIRLAREHHPKAIFLDLVMPGMNGYQVLELLRSYPETKSIPVIINTSELLGEDELKRLTAAAAAIILKDVSIRISTSQRIREALGKAGLAQSVKEVFIVEEHP